MPHSGREEQAAPRLHLLRATVGRTHPCVVVDRVVRGEPRVAHAVEEDQLSAMPRKGIEVRPARRVPEDRLRVGRLRRRLSVDVLLQRSVRLAERAWAGTQEAGDAAARRGDAGVVGNGG